MGLRLYGLGKPSDAELIEGYKHDDKQLPVPPTKEDDCDTDEKLSAFWLVRLLRTEYPMALQIVLPSEESAPRKPLVRLLDSEYWRKSADGMKPCHLGLDGNLHAQALAAYLFSHGENRSGYRAAPCKQCSDSKSPGPCACCVRPADNLFAGACTNCMYSGFPNLCSLLVEQRQAEAAARHEANTSGSLFWFDREDLVLCTREELRFLRDEVIAALIAHPQDDHAPADTSGEHTRDA